MTWQRVCAVDEIASNTIKKFEVDGISFVVANYGEGFRAFPPSCPHMQEPLDASGMIDDCILTCEKHVWQWDLRTCEKATGMTEEDLLFYELKEEDGEIFIDISQELVYPWEEDDEIDDDDFFGSN